MLVRHTQDKELNADLSAYHSRLFTIARKEFDSDSHRTANIVRSAENAGKAAEIICGGTKYNPHSFQTTTPENQRAWIREKEACIKAFGKTVPPPESLKVSAFLAKQ